MKRKILNDNDYKKIITVPHEGITDSSMNDAEIAQIQEKHRNDPRIRNILIPEQCMKKRILALSSEIASAFHGDTLDFLVVLKGAMFFAVDLSRAIHEYNKNVRIHVIKTTVYSDEIKQSNDENRTVTLDLAPGDMRNKDVLLIEDITDQGFTMTWLMEYCTGELSVRSLTLCTLFDKILERPSAHVKKMRKAITIHHTGFLIPDVWIAGYGVDAAGDLRNLPYIVAINQDYYRKKA